VGYACPVCETPHADATHLANHLAFSALLGDDEHEAWLGEHVPGWDGAGERELASRVVEHAPETEFRTVFEDTTERTDRGHEHDGPRSGELFDELDGSPGPTTPRDDRREYDPETAAAIEDAREMVRESRENRDAREADDGDGRNTDDHGDGDADENG
jgi:hypothetical protein